MSRISVPLLAMLAAIGSVGWFAIQKYLTFDRKISPITFVILSPLIAVILLGIVAMAKSLAFRDWLQPVESGWPSWALLIISGGFLFLFYLFFGSALEREEAVLSKFIPIYTIGVLGFSILAESISNYLLGKPLQFKLLRVVEILLFVTVIYTVRFLLPKWWPALRNML
jgi:hypothetical protein